MSDDRKDFKQDEGIQIKGLIIGCGHKTPIIGGCECAHPESDFFTMDYNGDLAPDIVADYKSSDLQKQIQKKIGEPYKLSSIVYEHFPDNLINPNKLIDLLEKNGRVLLVGGGIKSLIHLNSETVVQIIRSRNNLDKIAIMLCPKGNNEINAPLQRYMKSYFESEEMSYHSLAVKQPECQKFIFALSRELWEKRLYHMEVRDALQLRTLEIFLNKEYPNNLQDLKAKIAQIAAEYKPGMFRSIFGKTKAMEDLIEILDEHDPLSEESVVKILHLIDDRYGRMVSSLNLTRSRHGATSKVLFEVAAMCLAYHITSHEKRDEKKLTP